MVVKDPCRLVNALLLVTDKKLASVLAPDMLPPTEMLPVVVREEKFPVAPFKIPETVMFPESISCPQLR